MVWRLDKEEDFSSCYCPGWNSRETANVYLTLERYYGVRYFKQIERQNTSAYYSKFIRRNCFLNFWIWRDLELVYIKDNFFVLNSEEVNISDLGIGIRKEFNYQRICVLQHFIHIFYCECYIICYIRIQEEERRVHFSSNYSFWS